MTRIADYAASNTIIKRLLSTQARLHELEVQSSTEKVSPDYQGIARDSERLVNLENTRDMLQNFVTNNEAMDLRLKTTSTVIDGVKKVIIDFREALFDYEAGSLEDEQRVKDVQDAAFRALTDIGVYLNSEVDGRYIFSGARVTTEPVDLGLTSLADFQSDYDGDAVIYPPTRDAHVETSLTTATATTGNLTFTDNPATPDTITAANAGTLSAIPVGSVITIAGSATHDGTYTVVSNDGTTIEISGTMTVGSSSITVNNDFTTADETVGATISVSSYYNGDTASQTHRAGENRTFALDLNAIDPAFEKAIRAMGLIAQGVFGTAGGLDQHSERIDQAIYLVNYSLDITAPGTAPFGTEQSSNISQISQDIGYERLLIDRTNEQNETLIGYFDQRISKVEDADTLDVVSKLLDLSNALEAAYQAVARIRQLSLNQFL